jgi:hypothetical protein
MTIINSAPELPLYRRGRGNSFAKMNHLCKDLPKFMTDARLR